MIEATSDRDSQRVVAYEALRGWAALTVVIGHSLFGFGLGEAAILPRMVLRFISNVNLAVPFFFTLSGFVLTRRYFRDLDSGYLVGAALKRWPRLAFLTTLVVLISWGLRRLDLFWYREAGALTGSDWLSRFAYGHDPTAYAPDIAKALKEGLLTTFTLGQASYDASMWTMQMEFYGSFLVFALAYVTGRWGWLLAGVIAIAAAAAAVQFSGYMVCFVAGTMLAFAAMRLPRTAPLLVSIPLLLAALLLPAYWPVAGGTKDAILPMAYYAGCSVAAVAAICFSPDLGRLLSGRVAAFLGRISFPLYLVHILVLTSLGSYLYVTVAQPYSADAAIMATIAVSVLASIPLAWLDARWLRLLNGITRFVVSMFTRHSVQSPQPVPRELSA
jgi:peptidoglycan/LPS O-acetylase OafA/YrhL